MKNNATAKQTDERPFMEELERRLLMSADVLGAFASNAVYQDVEQPQSESALVTESDQAVAAEAAEHQSRELIIIDAATPDYESLLADLTGNADEDRLFEIAVLDPTQDGVAQISDLLSQYSDLDAVHIISHGSEGSINLGSSVLDYDALIDSARDIEGWGDAFTVDGDLLIYGCNLAANEAGQDLVAGLSRLTETDVAASDDLTGAASLGGDWDLEHQVGEVETSLAVTETAMAEWQNVLAAPVATADSFSTNEDTLLVIDVLANDSDPDGDPLTAVVVSAPSNGTLVPSPLQLVNETNLSNNTANDREPDWSPDGSQVAFRSNRSGNDDIWVMDADGSNLTQLTTASGFDGRPVWSPDGTQIVFGSNRDGNDEIYVMNADGTNQTRLTNNAAGDFAPTWSADGTQIAFKSDRDGNDEIYVMNADGTGQTNITNNAATDSGASWSPDGSKILFISDRDGNSEIYVMDADGSNPTRLTNEAAIDNSASWSPDGSKIIFKTDRDGNNEIYAMDADGSNQTRLTNNAFVDGSPTWSPDGSQIAFQTSRDGNHEIYVADLQSDGNFTYTPDPGFTGVDTFSYVANDGTADSAVTTVTITVDPANDAPTFIDGSVGNWHFDEGSGDSVAESAIGISTGTLGSTAGADANDPTWTTGIFGQALHFDGVNDYIEIADAPGIDISGPEFSASLWMNPDSGPNQEDMLFMKGDRQGNINYYLSWKDSGEMTWAFKDSAGWHYQDMPVTLPTTGQWNHIAITFDRPTVSLYVNGTKYVFDNVATGGSMDRDLTANDEVLWIGAGRDAGALVGVNQWSGPFTGSIDELALFDRALTDAEIEAIRTSAPPAVTASAFSIDENSANDTLVGTVVANDQDIGDTLSYAITAGNSGAAFSIDANGQIKVANSAALDFETNPVFNLTIEATDDGTPAKSDTTSVSISLNDVNDAPSITSNGGGATANINVAETTTAVTTVTSSDVDGGAPVYSISGGADSARFSIDGSGGALTFVAAPDFEVPVDANGDNVYEVTVQVADGNGGFDTQTINVTVTDVSSNLVVTTMADLSDGDMSSAEALNASKGVDGAISLSEAITAANNSSETVTISFNITDPLVGGMHTFTVGAGGLPAIADNVIIDATTEPDYSGDPVIRIDGASAGGGVNGLTFANGSDGSVLRGLMVTNFSGFGIQVNAGADGVTIANNWIGTTGTGSTGVGNTNSGINIQGANTIVGGIGANDGNVITNNGNEGINVTGAGATGTIIQGNIIGLDPDGATGAGNTDVGIALLSGAHNTTIGGTTAAARNVISNNVEGIEINSNNNVVQGNYIGTDATGTLAAGNRSDDGVEIKNGATGNLIGGTAPGAGNLIAFNWLDGVSLVNGTGNSVLGNQIHSNGGLGIDLGSSGVTANDAGDADSGANDLQNFPVITSAELSGTDLTLSGSLDTDGISTEYRIEFFGNAAGTQDLTNGEASVYLDTITVTTDGSGDASFSGVTLSGVTLSAGDYVTATATRIDDPGQVGVDDGLAYGSTSEFAANISITVVNSAPTDLQAASTTLGGLRLNDDGGNDIYFVADDGGGLLGGLTTVTIEASFSISTPGADLSPLMSYAAGSNDESLSLFLKSDGRIWFGAESNGSPIQSTAGTYAQLFDGAKHHVAVSWNSSTGAVVFYIDGQQAESFTGYQTGQTITGGGELVFGQDQDSVLGGFKTIDVFSGSIYDVRIFNDVRTAGEITSNFDLTLPPTEPGMIANWTFDDLSATGVVTESVSGNNLTEQHVVAVGFSASVSDLTFAVNESAADGTIIGSLVAVDPDVGDTFTYSLLDDAGGRFAIDGSTGQITLADTSLIDFESATSHNVTVRVTDSGSLTYDEVFTIAVSDDNDAPVLDTIGDAALADIDEGSISNAGDLVSDIVASAGGDPITDPDGAALEGIAVTGVDDSNGTWEYSTDGGSNWIAFGAVSDSSAVLLTDGALDRVRFVPATNYNGPATFSYRAWDQTDANASGTTGVDASSNGGSTPFSVATETAGITVNPVQIVLYFSTFGDVTSGGAPGEDTWTSGDLIGFGDPGLSFEPGTTDGTLYTTLNLSSFATDADASINAMHFVSRDITVGSTNSIDLQTGDLLLAVDGNETFTGSDLVSVDVGQRDLFIFRPDVPGNYSSGSFILLLDTFASNSVTGVSLVEQNTTVGDVTLTAGSFVFNAGNSRDILHFSADDVGAGTTTGTTSTLIDGGDIGFDNQAVVIAGLDLIEADVTVSGATISAGNLLVTLDADDNDVGSNNASFLASDIFRLDVITTTMGSGTSVANAYAFIEGADVNLESAAEEVSALSLDVKFGSANTDPVIGLPGGDVTYTENTAPEIVDAGATVSDADALNFYQAQLRVDFTVGGQSNDRLEIFDEGTGAGQVGVLGNSVSYGGTTIGTFTGGNNGSQPLVITFNSMATEVAVQSVMRNITYENVSDDPSIADRTARFILSDGEGGTSNEITKTIHVIALPDVTVDPLNTNDNTPQLTGTVDDPTATIDVTVNGTTYVATNNGDGTWTLADNTIAPALADGTYDVSVTATDALSNVGTDASINELTVDTTAPIVTVTGLATVDNTPQLTGTVNDPAATVDVTVNGTTYAATNNGDGTWTLADNTIAPALADGTYDVSVTATDALSNVGTDASINELTVDTTAPIVTVTGLATVDNTPQLTGTVSDPTATVDVTVNGTTYAATNNGDGTWTLANDTIAPALADGTYDVSVTATDALSNVGTDGSTNELTVDTTAPIVTVTGLSTVDNTPQLTGNVNDPAAIVDVTVNGTTYAATNNGDGTWTLADDTIAPALADGTYDVSVTATDALSNVGTDGSTNELTVDTTAPIVTITGLTTVDNTPALTGTVNDPTATVDVTVNGTTYAATNNGDGTWTLADDTIAPALADGTYDVSVTATDALSNVGTDASTNELTVDTTAPIVTVTGLTTVDNTPALTGTVSDPAATVDVTVNGTTYAATNNGDGTWTLADNTIAPTLADGTYDVSVTATDGLGNSGSDGSTNELTVDTTAPIVTITGLTTVDNTPALTGTVNDPTATVDVTVNGTTYAATNNGDGTWTLADNTIAPALADGTYDVSVTATDGLGNAGSDGSTNELTVDTTAPLVTVTGLSTVDNTPQLTGTVNDPAATVDVTVNGTTYTATNNGDGTWTLADNTIAPALADGTYDVSVTATDALSNVGTDASVNELTVDTTAPIVTVTGLTTVDNTPQLTGTVSDPTATVDVTVNSTTYAATNNGDGTWTLADNTIAPALADGTYDVSVTATDALSNVGTDGSTNELTVDTAAPIVTVTGLSTVDNTPQLTGTVSDTTATVDVTVNGTTYAATNNGDGTWTLADDTIAPALADGTYDVSVTATDALGNAGADGSTNELTVDTTAPIVTVTGLSTVDNTPQLTGTVNDPTATIDVTVNGTTYAATNNGDGTWTLADDTIAPALADGTYDVSVTATDALSNVGTDASVNELTVDTTAPIVTVTGLSTVDNTPQLTGTVNDPTATIDVTVNGTTYAATNNGDGTWTLADDTIAPALADGTYDVSVTATDALSNVGIDGSTNELTVDTTAPIVTVTGLSTVDNTPALTGTVSDPTATVDVTVNGTTYAATNNGDGTWTLADDTIAPALADGTYDVSVTATDALSNAGTDASTNELTVDTTAPIVTVTGLATVDNTPQLTGTVNDPAATVDVAVNGTTYTATNNGDGTWTLADNAIAPALADGTYDVSVTATDSLGNAGSDASIDELVVDTIAPIVTVTGLTTVDNTPALTGTVNDPSATVDVTVNGTTYAATNNGDGTWTLADNTIAPALADGTYDVSVTATDGLGNSGSDGSTNELTVDTTAPIVTITGLTTVDNTPALTGAVSDPTASVDVTVNGTTYAATNNGDGTWTLADDTIAPALADGTYDVSVTATDGLGNSGSDGSTNELTVDTTAPIVTITGLTTVDNTPALTGTVNDPTASVDVTVNGTTYAATNNGDGTWTLADDTIAPALADGTYDVSVTATDSLGNAGTDGSTNELTVDTTAPIVTVTGLATVDNTPQLTGTVSDPTATVDVTVNGTTYAATNNGDGTWTLADNTIAPALADGTYDVSVTATDALGNAGTDGSTNELTVDTTAPIVTVTGLSTVDNTPALTGTVSDPAATVDVTVNGTTYAATNNGDGTWTLADDTIAPALADGTYDVSVTATDALSNVGTDGSTNELTVDTTAPVVTVTGLSTVDNTPALTGTVSDPAATVDVTVNGTTYAATNNGDGTWTLADDTIAPALADGTYDVSVTATDAVGNVGSDASIDELVVDTTAPIVTITGLTTANNTPALTGTVSDPTATVQVTVNGTTYTATNNGDGTWTLADDTIAPALADGTYDVSVTATDGLGNTGTDASTNELTVDTTAPVVTILGLTTADSTPALTGTVSDPTATVQVMVDGVTYTATNNGDGTWTLADNSIAPALADGTYDVSVTATDGVGNAGTDASIDELIIDITAPVVTVTDLTTADNTPALTGTVSDPAATVQVTVNGTTYTATNNGDGTWTLADNSIAPALADGTYDVSVTATDAVGNAGTDGSVDELIVDTTAPVVTVTGLTTADNTPALTGSVSDPTATVQVTVNGTTYTATNNGDGTWTLADNSIAPALADGTYDVSVTATDAVGNAGSDASIDELVVDTTAPVVTVTGLTTADNTPALTGTVSDPAATVQVTVNGTTYTATNNGDGTWTLADNSIAPALADGTYDVSVTATDGLGNVGSDASIDELAVDTTAPVVTITGLTTADNTPALTGTVSDPAATVQVTVNGTTYTATNNGDGTWTLADNSIAPALGDGTYDVSATATDAVGNAGTDGSVDELIVDTTAPVVTVTGLTTADNTPALTGTVSDPTATVQVTVNGTTYTATNNGDGTWILADNSIAPALADGTYDVSVTATDTVGNVGADASVDELIVDTTAPVVTVNPINTADTTPQLTGTVSDPTATVQVTVDGTTYTATNNGDGTWTLADDTIAPALAKGTYDVSVTATDAVGNVGADASVDELVILNAPPVAGDDAITTDEDLSFTAVLGLDDLLLNDSDADGDPLTINTTPVSGPNNGGLILNSDGTFTYTPNADFNGTDSFVYEVSDGDGGVAQATVTITVNPINDGPTAVDDGYTTNEDQAVTAVLGVDDLLLNDSDTEGDSLTVNTTPVVDPANGTLVLNSDGTFTYTPDADFSGTDSFTYEITDGNGGTSQAVVTIAVNPVNDAPTTSGITDVSVNEDAPNTTIDLLSAFGDVDDGTGGLSFTVTQNTNPGLFNSSNINNILGSLTLDYAPDANGTADITVRATDGAGAWVETTFTVDVTAINDAPVIGAESIIVDEDVSFLAALGVDDLLLNDSDVDGDALSVNTTPVTGPANGTLLLNSDGTFTYTPNANFNGSDSFTYEVADGNGGVGLGVVTITVSPVNDTPVSADDNLTVDEDTPLSVMAGLSDLLMNDSDADGDALIVDTTPVTAPSNGALILNSDGTFTYTPNADFNGTDAFAYRVSDSSGATSQALVNIVVNAINDAPVAGGDAMTADGGVAMVFSDSELLVNDTDVDGDSLQVVGFTQPVQGLLAQNPDGSFAYTAPSNFTGMDSFSYTVADTAGAQDTVLVMVSVTAPTILIDPGSPPEPGTGPDPEDSPPGDQDSGEPTDNDSGNEKSSDGSAGDDPAEQLEPPPVIGGGVATSEPGAGPLENLLQQSLLELHEQGGDGLGPNQATPPKSFYEALQAIETVFDVEIPGLALAALNELPIWQALDAMRDEMNSPAEEGEFGGVMVMQMTTGASLALSAGFVSWILRGGALASALLSSMPMWQGFDPLPVLMARKKGRKQKDEQSERDAEILRESEVDRLFEAASQGRRTHDQGRPDQ